MEDCDEQTMLIIEASAANQNLNEKAELALSPFELATNDVYDLKIKIQNIIKAPACDQTLVYLGHTLDDSEHLRDLYLRCRDTLNVVYPVKADIDSIDFLLQPFKDFKTLIPLLCTSDGKYILQPLQIELKRLAVGLDGIYEVERLFYDLFNIYQTKSASSNRNYFKQVKGVEYLMSMLHFTLRQYSPGSESISDDGSSSRSSIAESSLFGVTGVEFQLDLIHYENVYNRFRRHLAIVVLGFLSIFLMEKHEVKLALQLGGLQPAMKWFLKSDEDVSNDFPTNLNLTSLCFLCSLVELDRNAQLQVAETEDVMEKLCGLDAVFGLNFLESEFLI